MTACCCRGEDAERFIEEVRGDEPDLASYLRIDEREAPSLGLAALGQNARAMIALQPVEMCWITAVDDATDQCAHGRVVFTIDSIPFATGDEAEDVTVSAAALFLLRTLTHDHTAASPVAEASQLFPHCGFTALPHSGRFPVVVFGCNVGIDVDVVHSADMVTISAASGQQATVTAAEWRDAVVRFVDAVQAFYDASPARVPYSESPDDEGWAIFWQEWRERRAAVSSTSPR